MFSFSRTILTVGLLIASGSLAQANELATHFPLHGPIPVERPMMIGAQDEPMGAVVEPAAAAKPSRRGHKSRPVAQADEVATSSEPLRPGTELAAPTPAETSVVAKSGPRESAAPTITDLVTRHAQENGVPVSLAQAVVTIESRGNPHAANGGALGLMQIKPGTARAAGFNGGAAGLFVAETNLHFGMKILGDAFRSSGGDVCRALMLYQSGHLVTHMSRSNRIYCGRARALMAGA